MDQPSGIPSYRIDSYIAEKPQKNNPKSKTSASHIFKNILGLLVFAIILLGMYVILSIKYPYVFSIFGRRYTENKISSPTPSLQKATIQKDTNPSRLVGVNENYLKLDIALYQLSKAKDPSAYAKRYELYTKDGRVRVVIELNDTNFALPPEYGIEETRNGALLQALVPINKLIPLADDVRIISIHKPD